VIPPQPHHPENGTGHKDWSEWWICSPILSGDESYETRADYGGKDLGTTDQLESYGHELTSERRQDIFME
jgi:hypothetical protein